MFSIDLSFKIEKIDTKDTQLAGIELSIARLDLIHPIISGNKIFKLYHFFNENRVENKQIVTFGGTFSNHLVATAFFANQLKKKCTAFIRGEKPKTLSHTLKACEEFGMNLIYLNRNDYRNLTLQSYENLPNEYKNELIIPEGGFHNNGALGASLIIENLKKTEPDYVVTAVGTATTLGGLLINNNNIQIIGIPVLKNLSDLNERLNYLLENKSFNSPIIFDEYHFGGYAKMNEPLLHFMNQFYSQTNIPTDFVYTGKMIFGMIDKIKKGFFKEGSKIIMLHTGGLQGNLSLKNGTLIY